MTKTVEPRFKDKMMQKTYDLCMEMAADKKSELYSPGMQQRRGTPISAAFWDGFNGMERTANAIQQTASWAAFQAGKDWAKLQTGKRTG